MRPIEWPSMKLSAFFNFLLLLVARAAYWSHVGTRERHEAMGVMHVHHSRTVICGSGKVTRR